VAVQLFAERARQADQSFELAGEMAARLVTRLDGMPLAIELAAARLEALLLAVRSTVLSSWPSTSISGTVSLPAMPGWGELPARPGQ
jgi:hypothetical protein